jgi:hypothetical protein
MALAIAAAGCAKTGPPPGYEQPSTQSPPRADSSRVAARPTPRPAQDQAPVSRGSETTSGAPAAPRLDSSEEITPEELASLPEPVPAGQAAPRTIVPPSDEAIESPESPPATPGSGAAGGGSSSTPSSPDLASESPGAPEDENVEAASGSWRVQIFASESRAEADRVAREASRRLDVEAAVEREQLLYKVRLGRFASESGALALRERAVRAGYSGAFRIKTQGG